MKRLAGLLRAVNVGGRKVLMDDLKRVAAQAGFDAPTTLLASGNLLFGTALAPAAAERTLEAVILEKLGVATDVMVRDHAQLCEIIAANPFADAAGERPSRLLVMFLNGGPQAPVSVLDDVCTSGEEIRVGPGCLYIDFPAGVGTSKLANNVLERRLKVRGTGRNWNTVGKLRDLLA